MTSRILIVDDHQIVREGLCALLSAESDMEVIGEASDGSEALRACRDLAPDLVLIDATMPRMNGIEATRRINASMPAIKVLCLSMHSEPQFVEHMLEAGAKGYLLKDCAAEELIEAIRVVESDRTYVSPAVAGTVVAALKLRPSGTHTPRDQLTKREREVLQLIAEGLTARRIADLLSISVKTVNTHREHIMDKLDIHSVAGLTKYAIQEGHTSLSF